MQGIELKTLTVLVEFVTYDYARSWGQLRSKLQSSNKLTKVSKRKGKGGGNEVKGSIYSAVKRNNNPSLCHLYFVREVIAIVSDNSRSMRSTCWLISYRVILLIRFTPDLHCFVAMKKICYYLLNWGKNIQSIFRNINQYNNIINIIINLSLLL